LPPTAARGTLSAVIDVPTLRSWIEALGYEATPEGATTLRVRVAAHPGERPRASPDAAERDTPAEGPPASRPAADALPPFYVQLSENWVLLSMLPMLGRGAYRPEDLGRRLLAANREMRLAKFALDKNGAVVLCAELPTESLDASEIADAVQRMAQYARRFAAEFGRRR
jgi:putative sensory transduction regulator